MTTELDFEPNRLYYGDCLEVLRGWPAECVDLVYLDPPFNSKANYNVLYGGGNGIPAQVRAFTDTWHWDQAAAARMAAAERAPGRRSYRVLTAFQTILAESGMLAYLTYMAERLEECRRVMRQHASVYLHCDPTASHYLKLLCDGVFGPGNFRNEIIWKRSSAHSDTKQGAKSPGRIHDTVLFYTIGDTWTWNPQYTDYDEEYVNRAYRHVEAKTGRKYRHDNLTAAKPGGDTSYEWRVKRPNKGQWQGDLDDEWQTPLDGWEYKAVPPYRGRYWAYSRENMRKYERQGRLSYASTGMPNYKRYVDEMPGVVLQDIWTDIQPVLTGTERLGYPTQKPVALLQRIIEASSDPEDVILDPFCGVRHDHRRSRTRKTQLGRHRHLAVCREARARPSLAPDGTRRRNRRDPHRHGRRTDAPRAQPPRLRGVDSDSHSGTRAERATNRRPRNRRTRRHDAHAPR